MLNMLQSPERFAVTWTPSALTTMHGCGTRSSARTSSTTRKTRSTSRTRRSRTARGARSTGSRSTVLLTTRGAICLLDRCVFGADCGTEEAANEMCFVAVACVLGQSSCEG